MANTDKEQLLALIERMPDEKLKATLELLQAVDKQPASPNTLTPASPHLLLLALVSSFTNTLYDLSGEAEKRCAKAAAKRLDANRRQVMQAWEAYISSR